MIDRLPPGSLLIAGALLVPLLRGRLQQAWMLLLTVLSSLHLLVFLPAIQGLGPDELFQVQFELFDYQLTPIRVDRLSLVWGYIFHIAAFISVIYALHVKDRVQHVSGLIYAGAAIGAVFAGDLITLFVYWELTAISSVFLIWASRSERAYGAGMRYLIIQVGSGVLLLSGILFHFRDTGSLAFENFLEGEPSWDFLGRLIHEGLGLNSLGAALIFLAFGIKAAFPLLHNWLPDSYPEATPTGTVFLSAFTTKLAIYALARGFAGAEVLVWIGAIMTAFPIFYAVIENDLRRVLAYSLNSQLGFMVVGIGIGTNLALNGTAAHAFAHTLYKVLLFMSMGAVLMRTGTAKGSDLGGLYKSMPWTTVFCIIGAASISAFPLLSGFVTKSLIMSAAAQEHYTLVWLVLLFASAGVVHYSGIKIPYFTFFAHDSGKRVQEAPLNMLIAMGIAAALCVGIGLLPGALYGILPYSTVIVGAAPIQMSDYDIYTTTHVITQYQLLLWSALAFTVLMRAGIYPPALRSVNLDTDWTYRKALPAIVNLYYSQGRRFRAWAARESLAVLNDFVSVVRRLHGPQGILSRTCSTGGMVIWAAILLATYLLLCYM